MIATTGQKATFGPLTTHDPLALTGASGAAAVAAASPIPHPMTCPARTITLLAMVLVPPPNTVRAPETVPVTVVAKPGRPALSAASTPLARSQATTRAPATVPLAPAMVTATPATLAARSLTTARERTTARFPAVVGPATTPPFRTAARMTRLAVTSDRQVATTARTMVPDEQTVVLATGPGPTTPTRPVMTSSGPRNSLPLGVIVRLPITAERREVKTAPEVLAVPLSARAPEAGLQVHTGRPGPAACSRDWVASARNPTAPHGRIAALQPANRVRPGVATTRDRGRPTYRHRGRPASQQPDTE
jgi:hypothetical protein